MISKKLSIAIPTYNRLNYLKDCVNSVLNQTFQDFSIFVFDNASDQPIEKELKKFNDKRIHFIGSERKMSQGENIKRIEWYPFESEYVVTFHDDDAMHPEMLELQTSFLDKNRDVVFVVSGFNRIYSKDIFKFQNLNKEKINPVRKLYRSIKRLLLPEKEYLFSGKSRGALSNGVNYIIYKNNYEFTKATMSWLEYAFNSAMYRVKFYTGESFAYKIFSDFTCFVGLIEISKNGPCALIDAPLVNYRIHPAQDFQALKENHEDSALRTLSFLRENLPPALDKKDKKLFNRYSLNFLIRAYADINGGFSDFMRFMKRCRERGLVKYRYFRYIDRRGLVSIIGIVLKNKKIIPAIRRTKDYLCSTLR